MKYTKSPEFIKHLTEKQKYEYLIDKTQDYWTTEAKDNYRALDYKLKWKPQLSDDGNGNGDGDGDGDGNMRETEYKDMTKLRDMDNPANLNDVLWENYLGKNPKEKAMMIAKDGQGDAKGNLVHDSMLDWKEGDGDDDGSGGDGSSGSDDGSGDSTGEEESGGKA